MRWLGGCSHLAEIFVFFVFLFCWVIFNGFAMVLAGVFGFFDFIGFSYGLSSEAAMSVRTHHCGHISCAYQYTLISCTSGLLRSLFFFFCFFGYFQWFCYGSDWGLWFLWFYCFFLKCYVSQHYVLSMMQWELFKVFEYQFHPKYSYG